jgi:hypothetical protein
MKWQKWKQIHLHHTISNTNNSGNNKRNEILPLHQEVVNRLEAHFTNMQVSNHSPNIQSQVNAILQEWMRICKEQQGVEYRTTP